MPAARKQHRDDEAKPGILIRLAKFNLCVLLALVVPFCILLFRPPVEQESREREELKKAEAKRDALAIEKAHLRRRLDLIQHDPEYLEVVARDTLQMQKDGEVVFRFEN
jgi:cell division protein FtsB